MQLIQKARKYFIQVFGLCYPGSFAEFDTAYKVMRQKDPGWSENRYMKNCSE